AVYSNVQASCKGTLELTGPQRKELYARRSRFTCPASPFHWHDRHGFAAPEELLGCDSNARRCKESDRFPFTLCPQQQRLSQIGRTADANRPPIASGILAG